MAESITGLPLQQPETIDPAVTYTKQQLFIFPMKDFSSRELDAIDPLRPQDKVTVFM